MHTKHADLTGSSPGSPVAAAAVPAAVLVAWRSRRSTSLRLFAPFIFLLLALIVNLALNANNALQVRGRG
jgi:hypothetical protein